MDPDFPKYYQTTEIDKFEITTPSFQRPLNLDHVNDMYEYAMDSITKNKTPIFNSLVIGCVPNPGFGSDTYYIIDGQHRLEMYRRLHRNGIQLKVLMVVYRLDDQEEARTGFRNLNTVHLMQDVYMQDQPVSNVSLIKQIEQYLLTDLKYIHLGKPIFKATRTMRPFGNITKFMDTYCKSTHNNRITTLDDFITFIDQANENLRRECENPKFCRMLKISDRMLESFSMYNRGNGIYIMCDSDFCWLLEE